MNRQHATKVMTGFSYYRAVCSCGWYKKFPHKRGPDRRRAEREAQIAAYDHTRERPDTQIVTQGD